jgi:multicomponent K+:H+ antiporter subunit E
MKRWLPYPLVTLGLCVFWLLLNQDAGPGNLLLGAALGIAVPLLTRALLPLGYPRPRRPAAIAHLLAVSLREVVRSCFNVSRIILFADYKQVNSQFVRVPLDLRDPYGLALLSCLINMTPGTVWVEILPDYELALHVFDLHDEEWWIATIKQRYEQPIIAIFEPGG